MGADRCWSRLQCIKEPSGIRLVHQLADLVGAQPGDLLSLGGGLRLTGHDAAPEDQGDDPAPHVLVDAAQRHGLDLNARLLLNLLEAPSGRYPGGGLPGAAQTG